MVRKFRFLFFVLFIEGTALMAVELMGAKLVAPFYGSSLYVWTATLTSAVSGLTLGYYYGGILSKHRKNEKILFLILGISAVLVFLLPHSASVLMKLTSGLSLIPGICITCLLLIAPPLFCFGMVGPVAVRLLSMKPDTIGATAGTVYFTSTAGGVLSAFLFGCYLIPFAGLKFCALATALSLALLPLIYMIWSFIRKPQTAYPPAPDKKNNPIVNIKKPGKERKKSEIKQEAQSNIYLYAVLEGATVMAAELIAARMMAPYFGASLFVWAAVIGFTLSGLAAGYYFGGRLADKYNPLHVLQWALLAAASCIALMHFFSQQLTMVFEGKDFNTAIIAVSFLLVFPPILLLGMIPTLLIRHITTKADDAGATAGTVYAISSASGIISLLLFGFYILPQFGLAMPAIITGIIAGLVPFIRLMSRKKYLSLLFLFFILVSLSVKKTLQPNANVDVPYYSEGLLGQVMVADVYNHNNGAPTTDRILFVNRIGETFVDKSSGSPQSDYIIYVSSIVSKFPERSNALLLGLGGGSIANMMRNNSKFNVDVAELDERIADVSRDYFSLSNDVHVTVDDARHYLETTNKKYDIIFFDVYRGEMPPAHVLSLESFERARSLLNKNGLIIVNFFGFLSGDMGKAGRSVYKTLRAAGLKTRILPTAGTEEERNLLFIASAENEDFSTLRFPLLLYGKQVDVDTLFAENKIQGLNNASVLTDDKPVLDVMVLRTTNDFREGYNSFYGKLFRENGIPLFE